MTRAATVLCALSLLSGSWGGAAELHAQSAEELYTDYFGCWNCHGQQGEGGEGQPLRETYLPLALFVKTLRLPAGEMPVFNDVLATDAELAAVYDWLDGVDEVVVPSPVEFTVDAPEAAAPDSEIELGYTAEPSREGSSSAREPVRLRYRLTLVARDNSLLDGRSFEYMLGEGGEWTSATTDRYGQALLGPPSGVALSELSASELASARLRVALPEGGYVFVMEAVEAEEPAEPAVFGVGTASISVE